MAEKFQFLNGEVDISGIYNKLTPVGKDLLTQAEQYDREGNEIAVQDLYDEIEVYFKNLVPRLLTKKEWEKICERYNPF